MLELQNEWRDLAEGKLHLYELLIAIKTRLEIMHNTALEQDKGKSFEDNWGELLNSIWIFFWLKASFPSGKSIHFVLHLKYILPTSYFETDTHSQADDTYKT